MDRRGDRRGPEGDGGVREERRFRRVTGLSGRYAEIAQAVLVGQTAAALDAIRDLPPTSSVAESAWRTALALRATQDWRSFGDPAPHTLLERLEYLRALVVTRRAAEVLTFVGAADAADFADVSRLTAPEQLGVELGNRTVLPGLPALLAEIDDVRAASLLPEVDEAQRLVELGKAPGRCIGPAAAEVLDWGSWAGFYSRAIAEHVALADTHLRRVLNNTSAADS